MWRLVTQITALSVDYDEYWSSGKTRIRQTQLGDIINLVTTKAQYVANHAITKTVLSSVLSAHSGIVTTKSEDRVIINIDEIDKNNELAEVEYVDEIYTFYKLSEEAEGCTRDYMISQPLINARMRARLLDWIIKVHDKYGLKPETLYLTINIVDRYLSVTTVTCIELGLVGISALLISSKYEEMWPLEVNDIIATLDVYYSTEEIWPLQVKDVIATLDLYYSSEEILAMEKAILSRLGWYITVPTPYVFTVRYAKASLPTDNEMENMVLFFTELGLMDYLVTIKNNPSMLAASAVYAARCTLNKTPAWTETLQHYTGYTEDQVRDCAKRLVSFHASASDNKFNMVYKKYLNPNRGAVARFPPATSLLVVDPHKLGWDADRLFDWSD